MQNKRGDDSRLVLLNYRFNPHMEETGLEGDGFVTCDHTTQNASGAPLAAS